MTRERRGLIAGVVAGLASVGLAFGVSATMRSTAAGPSSRPSAAAASGGETSNAGAGSQDAGKPTGPGLATGLGSGAAASGGAGVITLGKQSYARNCSGCHGGNAQGGIGPDLRPLATHSSTELTTIIRNGIKPAMPAFGGKLKKPEIDGLVAFIHSLKS